MQTVNGGPDDDWQLDPTRRSPQISGRQKERMAKPNIKVQKELSLSPLPMMLIKYLLCARLCVAAGNTTVAIHQCHSRWEICSSHSASTTQSEGCTLAANPPRNYAGLQPINFYHFLNTKRILLPITQQVKLIFIRVSEAERHDEISRCALLVLDLASLPPPPNIISWSLSRDEKY